MRTVLALLVVLTAAPLAARAHTQEDETACRPDVFRLCKSAIPNRQRIVACLSENKRNLSPPCFRVFDRDPAHETVPAAPIEPARTRWGQ